MLVCDKCNAGILQDSKFCPQCGDLVTEADVKSFLSADVSVAVAEISFGYSASSNYLRAVNICENIPSYSVSGDGKNIRHKISIPVTEVDLLINIYDLVGSWKSSQMLIAGHPATKKNLTYYGLGCFRNRQKSYSAQQYCFGEHEYEANIWGCSRLNMPISEWGGGWLDYGHFDERGRWHFDKDRIRHELDVKIKENDLCPVLSRKKIMDTVDSLPMYIDPKKDANWEYVTGQKEVNGEWKEVYRGIKPVLKKANEFVVGDYSPIWKSNENRSENVIKVDLSGADDVASTTMTKRTKVALWIIGVLIVIYLLA